MGLFREHSGISRVLLDNSCEKKTPLFTWPEDNENTGKKTLFAIICFIYWDTKWLKKQLIWSNSFKILRGFKSCSRLISLELAGTWIKKLCTDICSRLTSQEYLLKPTYIYTLSEVLLTPSSQKSVKGSFQVLRQWGSMPPNFCNFPKLTNQQPRPLFSDLPGAHRWEMGRALHSCFFRCSLFTAESHHSRLCYKRWRGVILWEKSWRGRRKSEPTETWFFYISVHTAGIQNNSGNINTCAACSVICFCNLFIGNVLTIFLLCKYFKENHKGQFVLIDTVEDTSSDFVLKKLIIPTCKNSICTFQDIRVTWCTFNNNTLNFSGKEIKNKQNKKTTCLKKKVAIPQLIHVRGVAHSFFWCYDIHIDQSGWNFLWLLPNDTTLTSFWKT